jgi:class 3 adenylate cyclase/CHASE2 domain-containing sensor protein
MNEKSAPGANTRLFRRAVPWSLGAALVAVVVAFSVLAPRHVTVVAVADNWVGDTMSVLFQPYGPQHPDIVLLTLNESTLASFACRSPIDRGFLAGLLDTLGARGVRAVGFDVLFDQPTDPAKDDAFRAAVKRFSGPVVTAWTDRDTGLTDRQWAFQKQYLDGVSAGYANLVKDASDGTVRATFGGRTEDGVLRPGFAAAMAAALGRPVPEGSQRVFYRLGPDLATRPFRAFPAEAAANLPPAWLKDRIVLVGADLPHDDRHRTPLAAVWGADAGTVPGLVIQAHMLAQMLEGRHVSPTDLRIEVSIAVLLGLFAIGLGTSRRNVGARVGLFAVVVALLWSGSALLAFAGSVHVPVVAPTLAFGAAFAAVVVDTNRRRDAEARFVRDAFGRYVSPSILKRLEANPEQLALGGAKRRITVIFTDIEGFTSFSETLEPAVLVNVLNDYLDALTAEVFAHNGLVDKFIGDAVMAVFGAPDDQPDHAARAVACAQAMSRAAQRHAAEGAKKGLALGRTRIGIHTGEAVVGNVGGANRFNYTAIGDVVNTASRLEGANKNFGTTIILSQATADEAPGIACRPVGDLVLKGRASDLRVLSLVEPGEEEMAASFRAAYELMLRDRDGAIAAFADHLSRFPADELGRYWLERVTKGAGYERIVLEGK